MYAIFVLEPLCVAQIQLLPSVFTNTLEGMEEYRKSCPELSFIKSFISAKDFRVAN